MSDAFDVRLKEFIKNNTGNGHLPKLPPSVPNDTLMVKMWKKRRVIENIPVPVTILLVCIIFVFLPSPIFHIIGWVGISVGVGICIYCFGFQALYSRYGLAELYGSRIYIVKLTMYITSIATVFFLFKLNFYMMICSLVFCIIIVTVSYLTYNKKLSWINVVLFMAYIITLFIKIML